MGRIVAIGGGEIKDGETLNIDKFIVSLSGKERPSLLFIPTASHDAEGYIETVKKVYGELGCDVKILCLTKENIEEDDIRDTIYFLRKGKNLEKHMIKEEEYLDI